MKNNIITVAIIALALLTSCARHPDNVDPAAAIPIQHNGRIKSLDAFARETVKLLTGKQRWREKSALTVILEGLAARDRVPDWRWIRVDDRNLKSHLGLPPEELFFSIRNLEPSIEKVEHLAHLSQKKRNKDERPSRIEQKSEELLTQVIVAEQIATGESITVIPREHGAGWLSPYAGASPLSERFKAIVALSSSNDATRMREETTRWIDDVNKLSTDAAAAQIPLEIEYYRLSPFQVSWIAYLAACVLLIGPWLRRPLRWAGIAVLACGIAFHTLGLVMRVIILDRPPVSNMYESMVFMNWVLIVIAVIFALIRKNIPVLAVGALVSALIMIYGDLLPIDADLNVLVPVLNSTYWLTIHVLTIVASYGIFGLAMGLGHRFLILDVFNKQSPESAARSIAILSRVIQAATLLLGIGTVLGGVWANESWGRFWGWDPKETWALITFLGYLLVIHLRYTGRLGDFAFALSSIVGFQLVLMTWYGVNFILGRGLHSYGFGAGGMIWISLYLAAEALFIAFVFWKRLRRSPTTSLKGETS